MESVSTYVLAPLDGGVLSTIVYAKQGDSGTRGLRIGFVSDLTSTTRLVLEADTLVKMRFKLADGTSYESEATLNSSRNLATSSIPSEVMLQVGRVITDICLYQDEALISTSTFEIRVLESAIGTASGGVVIGGRFYNVTALTRAQYNSLTPSENTIYLVDDSFYPEDSVITLCLGSRQLVSTGISEGSLDEEEAVLSLFISRAVSEFHQDYSRVYADELGSTVVESKIQERYMPSYHEYLKLGREWNEEQEIYDGVAELNAENKIRLKVGEHIFEVNEQGVFFDNTKLGGGANVGQTISQINGLTTSEIGELEEVT